MSVHVPKWWMDMLVVSLLWRYISIAWWIGCWMGFQDWKNGFDSFDSLSLKHCNKHYHHHYHHHHHHHSSSSSSSSSVTQFPKSNHLKDIYIYMYKYIIYIYSPGKFCTFHFSVSHTFKHGFSYHLNLPCQDICMKSCWWSWKKWWKLKSSPSFPGAREKRFQDVKWAIVQKLLWY